MRNLIFILTAIFCVTITSCRKTSGTMTVIKDCTGQYLRFNNKDFPICNIESVSNIDSGTIVDATFKKIGNGKCADRDRPHCMTVHPYQIGEWIEVKKIK